MKKFLILIFTLFSAWGLNAQSIERYVIGSLGGSWFDGSNFEMDFTVGELAVTTIANASNVLTQGFHQPQADSVVSVEENSSDPTIAVFFPNPVDDQLSVSIENGHDGEYRIQLYNVIGQNLAEEVIFNPANGNSRVVFDFSHFATGNYFIRILRDNKHVLTGKVIKVNQ